MKEKEEIIKIALLVSCACVLQVAESIIPHPVPGVRLGLANMITLVAMVNIGFGVSLQIALMRTLISSLILGTFLSPSFMLSFSGALVSTLIMGIFFKLSTSGHRVRFSLIGISIIGSLGHNLTQISLAYLLLIKNSAVFLLWPWLLISGLIMGWITGMITIQVCKKIKKPSNAKPAVRFKPDFTSSPVGRYVDHRSPLHLISPQIKIAGVTVLALSVLILENYWTYASVFCFLIALAFLSRIRFLSLFSGIEKLSSLLLLSFMLPAFLTPGEILSTIGPLEITREGLDVGISFSSRIILLYLAASILSLTTSPKDLASGLERLLSPLRIFKITVNNLAHALVISWTFFPIFWTETGNMIRDRKHEEKKLKNLIGFTSDLIAGMYERANQVYRDTEFGVDSR
jgi:heptaprenyl diphosphate synthase